MAARKKKPSTAATRGRARPPGGAHEFAVVVEELRGQFQVFGEALHSFREHVDSRFDAVDRRFDRVEGEITLLKQVTLEHGRELRKHGEQLDKHGEELRKHGEQLDKHGEELRKHGELLEKHGEELEKHGHQLEGLRAAVDKKVDRSEVEEIVASVVADSVPP